MWGLATNWISPKIGNWNHLQCSKVVLWKSPICMDLEDIKLYIFRFPLLGICLPSVEIDYPNLNSRSFNFGKSKVVKICKPQIVTNYEYSIIIFQNFIFGKTNKGCENHSVR